MTLSKIKLMSFIQAVSKLIPSEFLGYDLYVCWPLRNVSEFDSVDLSDPVRVGGIQQSLGNNSSGDNLGVFLVD